MVNELFTKTKEWKLHYEDEVLLWKKLQQSIQRNVMAEFQHNMGLIPASPTDSTSSWSVCWATAYVAMVIYLWGLSAVCVLGAHRSDTTTQLGRNVLKPILKMFPGGGVWMPSTTTTPSLPFPPLSPLQAILRKTPKLSHRYISPPPIFGNSCPSLSSPSLHFIASPGHF